MRRSLGTSRALILPLAALVWLTVAAVIAAAPLLTRPSEQESRPRGPAPTAAPSEDPVTRPRPRLLLHARAAAYAPGALRLRVATSGTFRPTDERPARLRVVLTSAEGSGTAPVNRVVRRVALTDAALSAVFRHLRPGTWRWEVDAASSWTLALVDRDSGRVAVTAPPPPPPPAPEPIESTTEQAPSRPTYTPAPTTPSTPAAGATSPSTQTAPTHNGGGGQTNQPAAPFGGGGAPSPEGPYAP